MPFFKSFWRETGKNTGKWASNKVFGDGWSTPFRVHRTSSRNRQTLSDISDEAARGRRNREREIERNEEKARILEEVNAIQFNSDDPRVIAAQLDTLFTLLRYLKEKNYAVNSMVDSRIRAGILWLKRTGDFELASFYQSEYRKIRYLSVVTESVKVLGFFILMCVAPVVLLWGYKYLFKAIAWVFN